MIRRSLPPLMIFDRDEPIRRGISARSLLARDWTLARPLARLVVFISSTAPRAASVRRVA